MAEKFSLSKLLKSPFTGLYWTKVIMLGIGLFILLGVGYTGYKAVVKPTSDQRAQTIINHNYSPVAHLGGCASVPVKNYK